MTDRTIVTFESTLAFGAAIILHLFSQNRAAQRAVRWTRGTCRLRFHVIHTVRLPATGLGREASGMGAREHSRALQRGLRSEASGVGARKHNRTDAVFTTATKLLAVTTT